MADEIGDLIRRQDQQERQPFGGDAIVADPEHLIENPDGTFSSERTETVQGPDGKWYNVPSIRGGKPVGNVEEAFRAGRVQAVEGPFDNVDQAVQSAQERTQNIVRPQQMNENLARENFFRGGMVEPTSLPQPQPFEGVLDRIINKAGDLRRGVTRTISPVIDTIGGTAAEAFRRSYPNPEAGEALLDIAVSSLRGTNQMYAQDRWAQAKKDFDKGDYGEAATNTVLGAFLGILPPNPIRGGVGAASRRLKMVEDLEGKKAMMATRRLDNKILREQALRGEAPVESLEESMARVPVANPNMERDFRVQQQERENERVFGREIAP